MALTKIDLLEDRQVLENFRSHCNSLEHEIVAISAATGEGINELLNLIIEKLAAIPVEVVTGETPTGLQGQVEDRNTTIIRDGEIYIVQNNALIRRMARYDLENDDSVRSFQNLLKRWGIEEALIDAGVKEGDSVRIGDFEFTFLNENQK